MGGVFLSLLVSPELACVRVTGLLGMGYPSGKKSQKILGKDLTLSYPSGILVLIHRMSVEIF